MAVPDYLKSHEAVAELSKKLDLVAMFRRPEADFLSRLRNPDPTPETLEKYFDKKVTVHHDADTGITALTVHAFRPGDAFAITNQLLQLSEAQVNRMNRRRYGDAVSRRAGAAADRRTAHLADPGADHELSPAGPPISIRRPPAKLSSASSPAEDAACSGRSGACRDGRHDQPIQPAIYRGAAADRLAARGNRRPGLRADRRQPHDRRQSRRL